MFITFFLDKLAELCVYLSFHLSCFCMWRCEKKHVGKLFLIKDGAFIVFVQNIFTIPSQPVGNQIINENLSPFKINIYLKCNIIFILKREKFSLITWFPTVLWKYFTQRLMKAPSFIRNSLITAKNHKIPYFT